MDTQERDAFSPDEFAKRVGVGRTTVFAEIKDGRLVARKVGNRTLIVVDDAKAWLSKLPRAHKTNAA